MAKKKQTRIRGRLSLILLFILGTFTALNIRVLYIKNVHGAEYEAAARTQQVSKYDSTIAPNRGAITDRNNQTFAVSTTVYNIVLDVRVLVEKTEEEQETTIKYLSQTLEGIEYATLKEYITINPATNKPNLDTSWKVLAKKQPREVKEALEAGGVVGVVYEKDTKRRYPAETVAAHVIGFIRDAMWGIEKQYNQYMNGVPGRSFITYDGTNGAVPQEVAAQDGNTIVTTLDYNIQAFAEEGVAKLMEEFKPENAGVIVMDPYTAEIYAMASSPTFNLNEPSTPIAMEDEGFKTMWEAMSSEEQYEYLDRSWTNFNISSTFEPGSVFKPVVVAAALEEGIINESTSYQCNGYKEVSGERIRCHLRSGHGAQTIEQVLANSCNVGMMNIGAAMGSEMLYKYLRDFGFGSITGIDLPSEVSAINLMYTPDKMGPVELATMSFGQSFNATPLQCIVAMAATINGGDILQPYVVSQIVDKDGNVVLENKSHVVRKVISEEVSNIIRKDLITTIETGTGKKAKIPGYTYGGKTGTAQQGVRSRNEHTVSFIAFLPAENPQYMALIVMHKPESYRDGVTSVSPATKELFEKIIKYKGIAPSYEAKAGAVKSDKKVLVEDYTGATLFDVLTELDIKGLTYEIVGMGNTVTNQIPNGGTQVLEGTKVTLYVQKGEGETGTVVIPDVKGKDYESAVTQLIDAGLEVVLEGDETGNVVETQPKAGVTVDEKTEIKITIKKVEENTQEAE